MSGRATAKSHLRVYQRYMLRRDLREVLAIEAASFDNPWPEEELLGVLSHRDCISTVAELGERVIGFSVYVVHERRLHLLDFAVGPEFRRKGVGRQMVEKIVGKLDSDRRTRLSLSVSECNLGAQLFYRECGFRARGIERDAYGPGEDGYAMIYDLLKSRRGEAT